MELVAEFPQNPLFASELAKLQSGPAQRAQPDERLSSVSPPLFQFTTVENLRKEQSRLSAPLRKKHTQSKAILYGWQIAFIHRHSRSRLDLA
jgi:hypothetical protein